MSSTLIAPRSLRSTVLLPMLAVGLCVAFITVVVVGWLTYSSMRDNLQQRAETIAHTANYVAESISRTGEMQRVIAAMGAEQEVTFISIIGGVPPRIMASTRRVWVGHRLADIPDFQLREDVVLAINTQSTQVRELSDFSELSVTIPLLLSDSDYSKVALRYGVAVVHLDTRSTYRAAWTAVLFSTISFVVIFGLVGALGYALFRRQVLTPLNVISRHLSDRQTGAVFPASILAGANEINVVAIALNQALIHSEVALNNLEHQKHALDAHAIVSVADLDGNITYVNERFCLISGYSREELLGANHRIVNSGHHSPEFFRELWDTIAAGKVWHGQICNRAKDGSISWVESTLVPLLDLSGKPHHYISIRTEITEQKEASEKILRLNASLEEQVQELHSQREELRQSNEELEEKAEQLALTSKYKSEFLSNMSHELRTPLNSLLILSQLLAENDEHNLSEQQIEYAKTIQGAGKDLLALINDILDLSKIESGTVTLDLDDVSFVNVREQVERAFRHVAQSRSLGFGVELAPGLPLSLYTDSQRLQQVMKNLLSNAFKFTEKGQVSLRIVPVESGWSVDHDGLNRAEVVIGFYVTDTGIGLPTTKQKIIFEAFQQADTGTARRYGGTGLGLSISREIVRLLGGELRLVESEPGKGSTFVLYLPLRAPDSAAKAPQGSMPQETIPQETNSGPTAIADDRAAIKPGERTLLIIEDDVAFANILLWAARDKGFKGIVAARGDDGLKLADEFKPTAITLDLNLPDMDGWVVLERLKRNPDTRHIPVEIISAEGNRPRGLRYGVFEYLVKPVTAESLQKALADVKKFAKREVKDLLVADGDEQHRNNVLDLIGSGDVRIKAVASGKDALAALKKKRYDCIVLDLNLPDISVADLLEAIQGFDLTRDVPVIIYGMDELPQQEQERLKSLALKGIVKEVRTPDRLLDETALFLHRVVSKLPEERRQMREKLYLSADSLAGKKALVVDDDVRNIFALTAVLERHKMAVIVAENGSKALEELGKNPDVDIVLMDIMMPEMDGFEAMRQIRQMKQFESLPMIALTAKAMEGDREKCIEAGASDYVSKPVDTDQLVSLLRVWLHR